MLKRPLLILIITLFSYYSFGQLIKISTKGKFSAISSFSFGAYWGDNIDASITYSPSLKFGYNVNNHFLPFIGFDYLSKYSPSSTFNPSALSGNIGFRYYFFKNNLIFLESGLQMGKYSGLSSAEDLNFIYPGVGVGLNFNLLERAIGGIFSFDIMYRYSFLNKRLSHEQDEFLRMLGSSFIGLKLTFPFSEKEFTSLIKHNNKDRKFDELRPVFAIRISPLSPKTLYEKPVKKDISFVFGLEHKNWISFFMDSIGYVMNASVEPRFYYNRNKRFFYGQNIVNNTGNYLSLKADIDMAFQNQIEGFPWELNIGINWGLKRALGNKFYFDINLGGKMYYNWKGFSGFSPSINYALYYLFN